MRMERDDNDEVTGQRDARLLAAERQRMKRQRDAEREDGDDAEATRQRHARLEAARERQRSKRQRDAASGDPDERRADESAKRARRRTASAQSVDEALQQVRVCLVKVFETSFYPPWFLAFFDVHELSLVFCKLSMTSNDRCAYDVATVDRLCTFL